MSTPENPLKAFSTYEIRYVMGAFKYGNVAESYNLTKDSGDIEDAIPSGIVIINEFVNDRFTIPSVVWEWSKASPYTAGTTTSMDGFMDIADRTGGQFVDWLRLNVSQRLGMSTSHLTFALKTYFIGMDRSSASSKPEVITGNPLIFHVHNLSDTMNSTSTGTTIRLSFTAAYNTSAQAPTFCKPYQMTLTHKSGNLNNVMPEPGNGSCSIQFRGQEDSQNKEPRKKRLDKSKPMRTLKEAFDALEFDLNQQTSTHKRQLQEWLSQVRDRYVKKIKPPMQERGDELPIKFKMELDSVYNEYKLDNRNLPFEQTEERPDDNKGVTSIPFKAGSNIYSMVEDIMNYSIKVGDDAADSLTPKTFKTNISYSKNGETIYIFIKVKQIYTPNNSQVYGDTGPGLGKVQGPLEFTFKSPLADDIDITWLNTSISADNGIKVIEKPVTEGDKKPLVIYGNRETTMGERIPPSAEGTGIPNFFQSGYSGLRVPLIFNKNSGLENAEAGANIDISKLINMEQQSDHEMQMYGNPNLMFDLQRLPSQAAQLDNAGNAIYYKIPESYPIYIKIKIFLKKDSVIGLGRADHLNIPEISYYDNHYEVIGVRNNITGGAFYQHLMLRKSDDIV